MMKKTALFAAGLFAASSALADDHTHPVGGYVDAQFKWVKDEGYGFVVDSGALYLNHSHGGATLHADFAFSGDENPAGIPSVAQAYVGFDYGSGFAWTLGQFDSPYGFEAKDAAGPFNSKGLVAASGLLGNDPYTGIKMGTAISEVLKIDLLIVNPGGVGVIADAAPDIGVQAVYATGDMGLSLNYHLNNANTKTHLIDVVFTINFDPANVGLEVIYNTANDGQMAYLAHLGYAMSDITSLALQFDMVPDAAQEMGILVGAQFKLADALTSKLDYSWVKDGAQGVSLGAVYRF